MANKKCPTCNGPVDRHTGNVLFKEGDLVRLRAKAESPQMVVNGKRLGKYECVWFREVEVKVVKKEETETRKELRFMRAFVHPEALVSGT